MDLRDAQLWNSRTGRWAKIGAFVCFGLAGVLLLTSLASAAAPQRATADSDAMNSLLSQPAERH